MKIFKAKFVIWFIIIFGFIVFLPKISVIKQFTYNSDSLVQTLNFIQNTSKSTVFLKNWPFVASNTIKIRPNSDVVYFSLSDYDINNLPTLKLIYNTKTYFLEVDFDWDERLLDDNILHFKPFYVDSIHSEITYEVIVSNDNSVPWKLEVSSVDLNAFDYAFKYDHDSSYAQDIDIISREDWWAQNELMYTDSKQWKARFIYLKEQAKIPVSEEDKKKRKEKSDKKKKINQYLMTKFKSDNTIVHDNNEHKWRPLAWPIEQTEYVKWIVIHHTDTNGMERSSEELVRSIYNYHSVSRWWGDVWYNYLIGTDWKIFEWRLGWDYTVAAHALWNNRSTLWIALIWNYESNYITWQQRQSLDKLVSHLTKKYGINLSEKHYFHKECFWKYCTSPIRSFRKYPLVWHKDVGHTTCPWKNIYSDLENYRTQTLASTLNLVLNPIDINMNEYFFNDFSKTVTILEELEKRVAKFDVTTKKNKPAKVVTFSSPSNPLFAKEKENIKPVIIETVEEKPLVDTVERTTYEMKNKIKIRLSFPFDKFINIKLNSKLHEIKRVGDSLFYNNKIQKKITIKNPSNSVLEIVWWERYQAWDKEKKYNDNKYKGDITVYVKDSKLVVVNEVYLNDYLKWLGEVSNNHHKEKIKTIIIAARTYARWYMEKARKFPWEYYDGSDDPAEFQRYLGYSLELRTENVKNYVDETHWEYITYQWYIIKPWYFHSSNWNTRSFKEYCATNGSTDCGRYPFLKSVDDPGGKWKERKWHGVWISWDGATYFAENGWGYKRILKYFLTGVEINKLDNM